MDNETEIKRRSFTPEEDAIASLIVEFDLVAVAVGLTASKWLDMLPTDAEEHYLPGPLGDEPEKAVFTMLSELAQEAFLAGYEQGSSDIARMVDGRGKFEPSLERIITQASCLDTIELRGRESEISCFLSPEHRDRASDQTLSALSDKSVEELDVKALMMRYFLFSRMKEKLDGSQATPS